VSLEITSLRLLVFVFLVAVAFLLAARIVIAVVSSLILFTVPVGYLFMTRGGNVSGRSIDRFETEKLLTLILSSLDIKGCNCL
jgi:hypothetical protein